MGAVIDLEGKLVDAGNTPRAYKEFESNVIDDNIDSDISNSGLRDFGSITRSRVAASSAFSFTKLALVSSSGNPDPSSSLTRHDWSFPPVSTCPQLVERVRNVCRLQSLRPSPSSPTALHAKMATKEWKPPQKIEELYAATTGKPARRAMRGARLTSPLPQQGNQFASINAPTAGARQQVDNQVGDAPLQLYSLVGFPAFRTTRKDANVG